MRFKLILQAFSHNSIIPINYQYPLSAAIYKILQKADEKYAEFLHMEGYRQTDSWKGFKLFTFSDVSCPFRVQGDRLYLQDDVLTFQVSFHLPEASQHFIKGLFQSQEIDIADKKSKASFKIVTVEALANPMQSYNTEKEKSMVFKPLSSCVAGVKNAKGNYDFLSPSDVRFPLAVAHNWLEKLKTLGFDASDEDINIAVKLLDKEPKSRLIWIKAFTEAQTKIRGFMNFEMELTGKVKYIEVLYNSGAGLYNAQGMGMLEISEE